MQEQELFQGYEVKNWEFSPRLYKILAFSAIFNVLALLIVAQSNLLTTKGCDSPLVGGVCQVIDTLVVGTSVLSTDTEYVSKDYEPSELDDAEIIWVDRTGAEQFEYPEGYFALSNPELFVPQEIPSDGSFPSEMPGVPNPGGATTIPGGGGSLFDRQPELPKGGGAITGELPSSPLGNVGGNPTFPRQNRRSSRKSDVTTNKPQDKLPELKPDDEVADADANKNQTPTPEKSEKVTDVEINKLPLKNFAADVKTKVQKKEVDLSRNFKVVAEGVLTKDGKLDVSVDKKTNQKKSRVLAVEGDQQMVEVAQKAIEALGDSGWLAHLRNQGVEKINFTVVQDNDNLQVIITSDFPTPQRADTVSGAIDGVISTALLFDKNNIKKLGDDEKTLLSSAKATVNPQNKKQFVLNFVLPKATALDMITRKLNDPATTQDVQPTETKPSGKTAQVNENKQTTSK